MSPSSVEICKETIVHMDLVEKVKKSLPGNDKIQALVYTFKILGDPTRL